MTKRTVEIDDTLEERVNDAKGELRASIRQWIEKEKPENDIVLGDFIERWYQGEDGETYGGDNMSEFADSSVPVYTKEIEDTWYLYGSKLEEAYNNAGLGENPRDNNGMAAIYCYISQELYESYRDIFEEELEDYRVANIVKPV
ncbi:MAG: hypothetical protein ACYDHY_19905 [Acidiferrobacterales bacterium]